MFKKRSFCILAILGGIIIVGGIIFTVNNCVSTPQTQPDINFDTAVAELNFSFTRMSGFSTNQFAIWIEDSTGQYIKTIYATRFTADGGWKKRETALPLWVKKSNLSGKNNSQIDVITSATPRAGNLTYLWDGTNNAGETVPDGIYTLILEATLRRENQVYYRAPIQLGQGAADSDVTVEYSGDAGNDSTMISNVTVRTLR